MELILYTNFSKRKNSTKQPSGGTTYDVKMKAGCSTENPVFLIDGINLNVTYAKWNDAFYFVDEIVIGNNNIYEIHCSIDVLATFKTYIGNASLFVERSASDYDEDIVDDMLSASQDIEAVHSNETINSRWTTPGVYTLRAFSRGGINQYAYNDMRDILGILNNTSYGISDSNLTALVQTIGANLLDVSAYVSNVMWLPVALADLNPTSENIAVGFWALSQFNGNLINVSQVTKGGAVTMPTNAYTDFRAHDPRYSRYNVYLPGVGVIDLPAIYTVNPINYIATLDVITGNVTYKLYSQPDSTHQSLIGSYSGQLGVQIPYSTTSFDALGIMQTMMTPPSGIGQAAGGGSMAGGAMAAASWAANTAFSVSRSTLEPSYSINSAAGNRSTIINNPGIRVTVTNFKTKSFPTVEAGRPLYEPRVISNLSGFVKCTLPSLDTPAHGNEKDTLNNYLASGFYYE